MLDVRRSTSGTAGFGAGGDSLPGEMGGDTGGGSGDLRGGAANPARSVWKGGVEAAAYKGAPNSGGLGSGAPMYWVLSIGAPPYLVTKFQKFVNYLKKKTFISFDLPEQYVLRY